jgi:CHAT domain
MVRIEIPGSPISVEPDPALSKFFKVDVIKAATAPRVVRGERAPAPIRVETPDDDIVAVEYTNDIRLWMRADDYEKSGGLPPVTASRGRAWDWAVKTVHVLRLTPTEALGEVAGEAGALAIVRNFESKLDPAPGLYHVSDVFTQTDRILDPEDLKGPGKTLVLLHGTASNTSGSFKALSLASGQTELSIVRNTTPEWRRLREQYKDRILAFEHRTLSQSPVENAIELASLLPDGATLHLVSHSRGGLVGELLCLNQPLTDRELKPFADRDRKAEAERLKEFADLVVKKNFQIERFVRVACPARGTVLASGRLDLYLSVILNLAGLIPGFAANPFFEFFKAAAIQLIKARTNPESVPGIEAMMPESPLVHLLNQQGFRSQADLAVIAGNLEGDHPLGKLRDLATRLYYWEDHDLVVNTDSMYRGFGRKSVAHYFFDRGPGVNHFQYFTNHKTRDLLVNRLTMTDEQLKNSGFKELTPENLALERVAGRGEPPADAPILFLVPGFMGTHMGDDEGPVWLDFDALALGGAERFGKLRDPLGLLGPPYQAIVNYLQDYFQVIEFPYDWTASSKINGKKLAGRIEEELAKHQGPVHLLTHSTGSLIAQSVPEETWQNLLGRNGRWVQLGGVPHGTHAAVELISGQAALVRQLELLDYSHGGRFRKLFASWPGLLETLPAAFFDAASWAGFGDPPEADLLHAAAEARKSLPGREGLYVAGSSSRTPSASDGKADYSKPGDGRVLLETLPTSNIWYAEAAHGDLANRPPVFPAVLDLLQKGDTDKLPRKPLTPSIEPPDGMEQLLFPQESDLLNAALGGTNAPRILADIAEVQVSVLHGDISKAAYPVLVGHYRSDTIVSAERRLDTLLDGALSRRFQMGVYPGPLGTSDVVRFPDRRPPGAIVVGLGDVGKLTEDKLRGAVMQAVLRYALKLSEEAPAADGAWRSAAFTSVLIGTYGGETIDVQGSVSAVVRAAVEANRALRQQKLWDRVRLDAVQFVEVYQDLATQAIHAVNRLNRRLRINLGNDERIVPVEYLQSAEGSRDKRPSDQYSIGWWRRIEIASQRDPGSSDFKLRFNILTDRARSEESVSTAQTRRVDVFVHKVINCPDFEGRTAVALYELLVPKRIKQQSNDLANLVLEVDTDSAQYPWELMSRRSGTVVLPFATEVGFIRQFKTATFEEPHATRENTALVAAFPKIGDGTEFPELTGAAAEAIGIQALLQAAGYAVEPQKPIASENGDEVTTALYTGDYRILHLAGHGVVDSGGKTGLVFGQDDIFTADDVRNLPFTPDLVFLNCCHLGRILPQVNKLAASLSEAFIQIGCRAVVAAGWAVNDKAAVKFAREFYRQMLDGENFGRAVLEARKLVRREHPETNTWGAYQCYGNPDYRLKLEGGANRDESGHRPRTRTEFIESCHNLMNDELPPADGVKAVEGLLATVPQSWRDGELLCTFGDAFRRFGDFESAIGLYRTAVLHAGAQAPIQAVQKLANHLDRHAKQLMKDAAVAKDEAQREELRQKAEAQTKEAIARLEWLMQLSETPERWSLLGGAYRRIALFRDRGKNLEQSRDCYGNAHRLALKLTREIDPYPANNWMSVRFLFGEAPAALEADLEATMKASEEQARSRTDFWAQIGYPDSLLGGAMIRGALKQEKDNILKAYGAVLRDANNQSQIESVRGGVSDMRDLIQDDGASQVLTEIEQAIAKMTSP